MRGKWPLWSTVETQVFKNIYDSGPLRSSGHVGLASGLFVLNSVFGIWLGFCFWVWVFGFGCGFLVLRQFFFGFVFLGFLNGFWFGGFW